MSLISLPRMLVSETEGWPDLVRWHPTVAKLTLYHVAPLSLIPPLMYAFAQTVFPGSVAPLMEPPATAAELALVGAAFFAVEVAMVFLMGLYIQQMADTLEVDLTYADAYTLAAIAPTPLWLAALALFVPSLWFNILAVALAWVGSVMLIRRGIRPLFHLDDEHQAQRLTNSVTLAGVAVWVGLMIVLALFLGILLGWR